MNSWSRLTINNRIKWTPPAVALYSNGRPPQLPSTGGRKGLLLVRPSSRTCLTSSLVKNVGLEMFTRGCVHSSGDGNANGFDAISEETLESLSEYFDEVVERFVDPAEATDVSLSDGVLTVVLGKHGTYVINKQSPNRQIWLSSPKSGPKRYDFVDNQWVYKRDNVSLHSLLSTEISQMFNKDVDFNKCSFSQRQK